ncbi:SH3 domain-containing protein [Mesobacillus foraminis]|uniref:SH3 domain-containing protein n=1 Tax=Mesobacillus foraminis TaxID=279826 RepID=UPI001BEBDDD8|nr:SH3 domain-containing protein [Mesobacillus foraminis]MBT2757241.1 SH3 domain-containing protein [Mesobacillus foraminis]
MKAASLVKAQVLCFLVLFSLLAPFSGNIAEAAYTYQGKVNANVLNVRSKPGTTSSIVGKLKKSQVVTVTGQQSGWSKITFGKKTGWVSAKFLATVTWKGYVNATNLYLRGTPNSKGKILATLKSGTPVTVQGKDGSWLKITVPSSKRTGWVSASYISTKKPAAVAAAPKSLGTYYVNATSLNVRKTASGTAGVVGTLKKGTAVKVYKKSGNWSQIEASNVKGWVSSSYLSTKKPAAAAAAPKSLGTYYVNATSLNVRKTASGTAGVVGTLKKGTAVKVYKKSGSWSQIEASNVKGWVSSSYLSAKKPATVAAVPKSLGTYYVTATSLNVRKTASGTAGVVGTLKKGTAVKVYKKSGNWSQIEASNLQGWVSSAYLSSNKPVAAPAVPVSNAPKVLLKENSNLRKGPGTSYAVIIVEKAGAVLSKIGEKNGWVQVKNAKGTTGWVAGWLVQNSGSSSSPSPSPVPSPVGNSPLEGKVIVLDPGHGGFDSGAIGRLYREKVLNLNSAFEAGSLLQNAGAKVVYTRNKDVYLSLGQRVTISHQAKADAFVSFHYNACTGTCSGIDTFYYSYAQEGELARYIQNNLVVQTGLKNRGAHFGDYHVIRENNRPGVLVELGFISNPIEEKIVGTSAYQKKAARGIYDGLIQYFSSK